MKTIIVVRGGVVQEIWSDTKDQTVKVIDFDDVDNDPENAEELNKQLNDECFKLHLIY